MGTRLDPTANERTAYIDSLCQILTYARGPEELEKSQEHAASAGRSSGRVLVSALAPLVNFTPPVP